MNVLNFQKPLPYKILEFSKSSNKSKLFLICFKALKVCI